MIVHKTYISVKHELIYFIVSAAYPKNDEIKTLEPIIPNEIKNVFLPARAARCVTDAARLAVLRRRKSDSEDCCTKCRPGPII